MTMGELDYAGLREHARKLPSDMENIAILLFICFCLFIALVVNNLLIGLAVGDIESVRKNAEIKLLSLQVSQIQESRGKMFLPRLRRRFHATTVTEFPNKQDMTAERIEERYRIRIQSHEKKEKTKLACA